MVLDLLDFFRFHLSPLFMHKSKNGIRRISLIALAIVLVAKSFIGFAQNIPVHAQGLKEALITVALSDTKTQAGVYSTKIGVEKPTKLAVLLPGYPSVVRPVLENGVMTGSKLTGNFFDSRKKTSS